MSFPSSIPSYAGFTSTDTLAHDNHAAQSNAQQGDTVAIATKLGTGASTSTNNTVLRGNGAGTTAYDQVHAATDISGVLPASNGGTGISSLGTGVATFLGTPSSANLASAVTDETGSGSLVFGTSPSLTTPALTNATGSLNQPTIADFTNATHTHLTNATGGLLGAAAVPNLALNTQSLSNPYKFHAYLSGNVTSSTASRIPFDTEWFDTNNNFDATSSKGLYTVPVTGFYQINAFIYFSAPANGTGVNLIVNSTPGSFTGGSFVNAFASGPNIVLTFSDILKFTAGDTLDLRTTYTNSLTLVGGIGATRISGYLVSQT